MEVCEKFLGNRRARNYTSLIANMMKAFEQLEINITIKMHCLICHIDRFKQNNGSYSDEQGERFHQEIMEIEKHYKGKEMTNGLARYCWSLIRETNVVHKRQKSYNKKTKYFNIAANQP